MRQNYAITDYQFAYLALRTCQWSQVVLHQGRRFLDAFEQTHGEDPWENDEYSCMFVADRLFFVTAICHAVEYLERFNEALIERGDLSFQVILDAVATQETRHKIRELRNMNEHDWEYATGKGHKQEGFTTDIEKNGFRIKTNAFYTVLIGNAELFAIGEVEIGKLLISFKTNLPAIEEKTKEIYDKLQF